MENFQPKTKQKRQNIERNETMNIILLGLWHHDIVQQIQQGEKKREYTKIHQEEKRKRGKKN